MAAMMGEAVDREASPKRRRAVMWWSSGGAGGEWVVARRTERRIETTLGLERRAALEREALSLMRPTRSLKLMVFPIDHRLEKLNQRIVSRVEKMMIYIFD